MSFDAHKNLVVTTVATAPSPATSGTSLTVATGDGSKFPTTPFNVTISPDPSGLTPVQIASTSEIARVTNVSGDVLTITRAQESTTARSVIVGDVVGVTITAKTFTDIESVANGTAFQTYVGYNTIGGTSDPISLSAWKQIFKKVTISGSCLLNSIDVYVNGNSTNVNSLFAALYNDNSGVPGHIVGVSNTSETSGTNYQTINALFGTSARWVTIPISAYLSAGTYWLAVVGGNNLTFFYDSGGSDYTGTDSATWTNEGSHGTNSSRNYSIRASILQTAVTPPPGMVKLFDQTLSSSSATIDTGANGIPSGYDTLEVFILSQTADAGATANISVNLNGDTSASYDNEHITGSSSSPSCNPVTGGTSWLFTTHGLGGTASYPSVTRISIPGYSQTTFYKVGEAITSRPDGTSTNELIQIIALGWRNTSVINQLSVAGSTANLNAGSRLLIYGRPSSSSPVIMGADGWIDNSLVETWTYASASSFTVPSDKTGKYTVGTRVKLVQSGSTKYFVITSSSYASGSTTVSITGGSDYTLANSAMSAIYHSYAANPQGWPTSFAFSPSISGWSSTTTLHGHFTVVGNMCNFTVAVDGTSNATTATINPPISPNSSEGLQGGVAIALKDNGGFLNTGGWWRSDNGQVTPNSGASWTASNEKQVFLTVSYFI